MNGIQWEYCRLQEVLQQKEVQLRNTDAEVDLAHETITALKTTSQRELDDYAKMLNGERCRVKEVQVLTTRCVAGTRARKAQGRRPRLAEAGADP